VERKRGINGEYGIINNGSDRELKIRLKGRRKRK
jgi:hypothetical protein